jgi:7-carboxy-7-deazaguanine synthase
MVKQHTKCRAGATVLVETNNHHNIDLLPKGLIRIVDVKCPGSGEQDSNDWDNLARLRAGDQVKFVVADRADFEFGVDVVWRHRLLDKCAVLFAPVHGLCEPESLAGWILESRLALRLQLQLHKLIWSAEREDV